MKHSNVFLASVALAVLSASVGSAVAQDAPPPPMMKKRMVAPGYRPLTVGGQKARPVAKTTANPADTTVTPAGAVAGIGGVVAAPFNAIGTVGGPIGIGGSVIGGTIGGATSLVAAPFSGLFGGPVGISASVAPPLPIKARYAATGPVSTTYDEGYSQEVPVDKSGPIYQIDNGGNDRTVTPFTLLAFPIVGATSAITSPLRPAPVPHG